MKPLEPDYVCRTCDYCEELFRQSHHRRPDRICPGCLADCVDGSEIVLRHDEVFADPIDVLTLLEPS